ncbi:hypothetical protein PRIPAC_81507 [Pristionchus pacificus]|uniref:Uncharacterized protein n=1 Tax=Pristionchus pacificus TaxID=54126 RepID=A0A2A6CNK1_PRIPA|nr:hypothetical protein PRIPAC_81507 [Pristionchus pacificus]|eukprot:PDM79709.1 hypothetical protein PRIPAC_32288 [Pristionchus pacificus]
MPSLANTIIRERGRHPRSGPEKASTSSERLHFSQTANSMHRSENSSYRQFEAVWEAAMTSVQKYNASLAADRRARVSGHWNAPSASRFSDSVENGNFPDSPVGVEEMATASTSCSTTQSSAADSNADCSEGALGKSGEDESAVPEETTNDKYMNERAIEELADYLSIGAHRSPHVADVNLDESFIEDEEEVEDKSILNRDDFAGPNHRTPRPLLETIDDATQSNEEEEEDEAMREDILGRPAARQNVFCPPAFVVRCSMTTAIVIDEAGPSSIVEEKGIVAPVESFEKDDELDGMDDAIWHEVFGGDLDTLLDDLEVENEDLDVDEAARRRRDEECLEANLEAMAAEQAAAADVAEKAAAEARKAAAVADIKRTLQHITAPAVVEESHRKNRRKQTFAKEEGEDDIIILSRNRRGRPRKNHNKISFT